MQANASALSALESNKALVVDTLNESLKRSMRNLPDARYLAVEGLNVYDLLKYPYLIMTQNAVKAVQTRLMGQQD